jgi:serine/threonine-protein kinase
MPARTAQRIALPSRYRVVRHIANGGMASVWAAEDQTLGRLVAVKVLSPAYAQDESAQARFLREARAAARLSFCRHIVTVYDLGEHDGQAYMVMEHFAGGTVADRLREGIPIPRPQALRWVQEAAEALDCAHRHGVVHRDVKPANLLLDEQGRLAVGDFGIARVASEASVTQTGQVLGTAAYISPEQARGAPATAASDRYALAVVAFELLTGRRPFSAEHPAAQARLHVEATVPDASAAADGLPRAVDDVLQRGMAKNPDERPPTAEAFAEDLAHALGGVGDAATTRVARPPGAAAAAAAVPRAPRAPRPAPERRTDHARTAGQRAAADRPAAMPAPRRRDAGPPPAAVPAPPRRRSRAPAAALAALMLAGGAAAAVLATSGGGDTPASERRSSSSGAQSASTARTTQSTATATATATAQQPAASAPATTQAPSTQASTATSTPPASGSPSALNDQGFALLQKGDAAGAVPVLERSVQGYRDAGQRSGLGYAFALFNLGRALRLGGRPADAIPYLQERLEVSDNQRPAVESELAAACAAAGQDCGSTSSGPGGGRGNSSGKGNGASGKKERNAGRQTDD